MCLWSVVFYFMMGPFSAVKIIQINYKLPVQTELKRDLEKPHQPRDLKIFSRVLRTLVTL